MEKSIDARLKRLEEFQPERVVRVMRVVRRPSENGSVLVRAIARDGRGSITRQLFESESDFYARAKAELFDEN